MVPKMVPLFFIHPSDSPNRILIRAVGWRYLMIKIGTEVHVVSQKQNGIVKSIRIDDNGEPLISIELLGDKDWWLARFSEVQVCATKN